MNLRRLLYFNQFKNRCNYIFDFIKKRLIVCKIVKCILDFEAIKKLYYRINLFMLRKTIYFLFMYFILIKTQAQLGTLSGKILDSSNKKALQLATVTIYRAKDTSIITYRLSDSKGDFKVPSLPIELSMRVLISVSGFQVYRKDFEFRDGLLSIELGSIALEHRFDTLKEVIVFAEIPPVIFRKDTIEFNAASFKTLPTALVEDLLKKLPGIDVSNDGSIRVEGRLVNRILVDGKRFFGENYKMATRNLPANIIDKVQVMDDLEQNEFNRNSGDGIEGKVINLTFKKGVKKGWFGRVYAGAGSKERNELGGIANLFKDTLQLSVIGYDNNVNRSSFSMQDMREAGGFNRSGAKSYGVSRGVSGERFNINGISFGGGTTGVNRSSGLGMNLNHAPSKNLSFFAQYFYGSNRNDLMSTSTTTIPLSEGINVSNVSSIIKENGISHNINSGFNWKIDSLSRLQFNIGYSRQLSITENQSLQQIENNQNGLLSKSSGSLYSNDTLGNFNYGISFSHKFANTKKSFTISHAHSKINNPLDQLNESAISILYPIVSKTIFEQLRRTNSPVTNKVFSIYFGDEFNNHWSYSFSGSYENIGSGKSIETATKPKNGILYDSIILLGTSDLNRKLDKWDNRFELVYKKNTFRARFGINYLQQIIIDRYDGLLNNSKSRNLLNYLPYITLTFNKIRVQYFETVQPPSILDLIPVPDNSNPFVVTKGNQNLLPFKSRFFNTSANFINKITGSNFFITTNSSLISNSIARRLSIDSAGLQTYTPENIDQVFVQTITFNYSRKYKKVNNFIFGYSVYLFGGYDFNPVLIDISTINANLFSQNANFSLFFNWNDKVEFTPSYGIGLRQNIYNKNNGVLNDINFLTHDFGGTLIYRPIRNFVFTSNFKYFKQSVFSPNVPSSSFVANADITFSFLQNKRGQIKFYMNDLFNTNRGVFGSITAKGTTVSNVNILNRYFLVSFYYDIKDWSKRKAERVVVSDRNFRFN